MDQLAMWIGYAVMAACGVLAAVLLCAFALQAVWRDIIKGVPHMSYVSMAVSQYKRQYPPARWMREQMGVDDWREKPRKE